VVKISLKKLLFRKNSELIKKINGYEIFSPNGINNMINAFIVSAYKKQIATNNQKSVKPNK
jgi:hypothetical protein